VIAGSSSLNIWHTPHKRQIEDFILAVREDRDPLVNGHEGRKPLEIVLAVYESARTGKTIKLG
jgi:UDP-N-acetyl-2-amino-2-deoxyglucuronate dehydrogenase